ncbi:MAG TPA: hypothetical protein VIF15_21215 [Polyangiaceae bacterium]|jgi:hypothetical protein
MTTTNRTIQLAADQAIVDGLTKHTSDIPSLVLGNQTLQNADIVKRVEQMIANAKAAAAARVIWLAAVATDKALRAQDRQFIDDLKQTLRARFSSDGTTLAEFGLAPRKRAKPTPKTQVAAAAKAKATREARGTKGSKQLAEVHGDVTGVVVTPVTAPAPAHEPQPAPAPEPVASGGSPAPTATPPQKA